MLDKEINELIDALKDSLGPMFNGFYKDSFSEGGINSDVRYQFYLVDARADKDFFVEGPEKKNDPLFFTKEFDLVVQFTNKIDKELLIFKIIQVLNKLGIKSVRYNEESFLIQQKQRKSKPKTEIPLITFNFELKRTILLNDCSKKIIEERC